VEWEIPAITPTFYMAGLADAASNGNWANVDYGIYYAAGQIYVYHATFGIMYSGRIAQAGDKLRVWKRGDRVNFYHNGTALMPFYQYPVNPATPLFFDAAFFSNGASLRNPVSSFCLPAPAAPCALAWANVAGATFNAANNTLTKTAGTGWGNAGAVSQHSLPANADGGISWTIPTGPLDATFYMLGLSQSSPDNSWASVQYGIYYAAGQVYVYLSGTSQGFYGNVQPGDRLSILRTGNAINFYRNNKSFFGAAAPAGTVLRADLAMFSSGARVQGLQGHNMCTGGRPLATRAEEAPVFETPSLAVYPNPTSGRFTVALGGLTKAELRVLDLLGREVLQQSADGPLTELDLTGQPAGTYFVRVQADGFGQTLKVVRE
jgi:Secretion system C-terminal sorting domain